MLEEEIDSYLYQTVGQDAIDLIAQALEVPLYRRDIEGTAISLGNEYGGRSAGESLGVEGDETEDLYQLLSVVKVNAPARPLRCLGLRDYHQQHQPQVEGVAIGAILSNYQRVRMEQVYVNLADLILLRAPILIQLSPTELYTVMLSLAA